jgi:hypothetical protein
MTRSNFRYWVCGLVAGMAFLSGVARADEQKADTKTEEKKDRKLTLADGKLWITAPNEWKKKTPQNSIIKYEFAIEAVKPDETNGRMTISSAGGGVDANINRWIGQFSQPDGSNSKDRAKTKQEKVAGMNVHMLDVSGTYDDKPPFAPTKGVQRENYRMLAAVIETKDLGNYFVKFYGPELTVKDNQKAFDKMIESLERK